MWWVLLFGLDKLHVSDWTVWTGLIFLQTVFHSILQCSFIFPLSDLSSQIPLPSPTSRPWIFLSWRELKLTEGFILFKVLVQMRVGLHEFLRLLASDKPFQPGETEWHRRKKCINGSEVPKKIQAKMFSITKHSLFLKKAVVSLS